MCEAPVGPFRQLTPDPVTLHSIFNFTLHLAVSDGRRGFACLQYGSSKIVNIAKRYCCLVLLLAIVGAAGGYYYHIRFPPQYVASLQFEWVDSFSAEPQAHGVSALVQPSTLVEDILLSKAVLLNATEIGDLNTTPAFRRWNPDSIVAVLSQTLRIESIREPGSKRQFYVSFQSDDAETPQRVVLAVITAYERNLQKCFFQAGERARDQLHSASLEILQRIEQLQLEFANFRQSVSLIDGSGRVSQTNRTKLDLLLIQRQRLIVRRIELESKIQAANDSVTSRLLANFDVERSEIVESTIRVNPIADYSSSILRQELAMVDHQLSALNAIYHTVLELAADENAVELRANDLLSQIQFRQAALDKLLSRREEMFGKSAEAKVRTGRVELVRLHDRSIAFRSSSLLWGAALGILSAFLLACLREYSDSAFRSEMQLSDHFGLPVIGYLPTLVGDGGMVVPLRHRLSPTLAVHYQPEGLFADSIRSVYNSICLDVCGNGLKMLQVTSPTSGDNKSVVAANLAIAMAQSGKRVLLVDADFNCPEVHKLFGCRIDKSIVWLLQRLPKRPEVEQIKKLLDEVIIESEIDNLSVVGMGNVSSGFSASRHFHQLSDLASVWSDLFDMVIIDSPSLLAASNPIAATLRVDGVLLVIRVTRTSKWRATRAKRQLDKLQSNVLGIVVNGVGSLSVAKKLNRTRWQDRLHRLKLFRPTNEIPKIECPNDEPPSTSTRGNGITGKTKKIAIRSS